MRERKKERNRKSEKESKQKEKKREKMYQVGSVVGWRDKLRGLEMMCGFGE